MKIILDTNIYFSAFGFNGRMLNLVRHLFENDSYQIFLCEEIYSEIKEKLIGVKFQKLTKNKFSVDFLNKLSIQIYKNSKIIQINNTITICRDPKDNKFLELAKEADAHYIITGDQDLLILKEFEQIKILTPSEFIEELKLEL